MVGVVAKKVSVLVMLVSLLLLYVQQFDIITITFLGPPHEGGRIRSIRAESANLDVKYNRGLVGRRCPTEQKRGPGADLEKAVIRQMHRGLHIGYTRSTRKQR